MKQSWTSIKYTDKVLTTNVGREGLIDCGDISYLFKDVKFRDKVIFRFDCFKFLEPYFLKTTIRDYREALWLMIAGYIEDENELTAMIKELMRIDVRFNSFVSTTWYTLEMQKDLGNEVLRVLASTLNRENYFRDYFVGAQQFVILETKGFMYVSTADIDCDIRLPIDLELEVLSYAKNWSGSYTVNK